MKPQNGRLHTLMDYEMAKNEETGLLIPKVTPRGAWNSLTALQHGDELLRQEAALAYSQNRSLLFSPEFTAQFTRISTELHAQNALPSIRQTALKRNLDPLLDLIEKLSRFARDGIRVVTTRQGASVCFGYTPFIHGGQFDILDLERPRFVPSQIQHEIERMVEQANLVLPVVIPGLTLKCEMKEDVGDNGETGARVFLYSLRNGVQIPFWAESEGIRRIVGILSLLVRMFNETDTCIAIDEIDSGIFEVLLGDILRTLAQRGRGQLISLPILVRSTWKCWITSPSCSRLRTRTTGSFRSPMCTQATTCETCTSAWSISAPMEHSWPRRSSRPMWPPHWLMPER